MEMLNFNPLYRVEQEVLGMIPGARSKSVLLFCQTFLRAKSGHRDKALGVDLSVSMPGHG